MENVKMTTGTLAALDHDQVERARDLAAGALKRSGLTRAEMRAALQAGFGQALHSREHPSMWAADTPKERAACAVGRLLLRLRNDLSVPLEAVQGPSALSIASELLT